MTFADGILQKQQFIHGLKHDITIALNSIVPIIYHKFHNCKGHQGTIHIFKAIRKSYWFPKLHQDAVIYINKSNIYGKNLHNMAKYPQKTSRNPTGLNGSFIYRHYNTFVSHIQGNLMSSNGNLFTQNVCVHCSNEGKIS